VQGFDVSVWYGVFAAAGTPQSIVQKLNAELVRAMNVPEVKQRIEASGYQVVG
jgi:tripartite-type tricarboxylate transporter receptor subunit TctC